jgi:hypothetical protein
MTPSFVLSRPSPCNVPKGYASVAELPVALLGCHFEHPAEETCRPSKFCWAKMVFPWPARVSAMNGC